MSFSYSESILSTRDHVRLNIGDTDASDPQLADEEIDFLLTRDPDPLEASIAAADSIAARYARQVDFAVSQNLQMRLMQKQESYERLADRLRRKIARRGIAPYLGGASLSERATDAQDDDLVQPVFTHGMEEEAGNSPNPTPPQPFPV